MRAGGGWGSPSVARSGSGRAPPGRRAPRSGDAARSAPASVHSVIDTELVVVGAGLAGLVAEAELADAGKRVVRRDQEKEK